MRLQPLRSFASGDFLLFVARGAFALSLFFCSSGHFAPSAAIRVNCHLRPPPPPPPPPRALVFTTCKRRLIANSRFYVAACWRTFFKRVHVNPPDRSRLNTKAIFDAKSKPAANVSTTKMRPQPALIDRSIAATAICAFPLACVFKRALDLAPPHHESRRRWRRRRRQNASVGLQRRHDARRTSCSNLFVVFFFFWTIRFAVRFVSTDTRRAFLFFSHERRCLDSRTPSSLRATIDCRHLRARARTSADTRDVENDK